MKIGQTLKEVADRLQREVPSLGEGIKWLREKVEFVEGQNRRLFFATSTYVGDYTAITWITSGQRIFVDTRDLGIAQHLMFKGFWEKTTNQALRDLLRDDSVYVDVGAHYGYHVLTAGQKVRKGHVVAVEPNPRLFGLLEKSVRVNQLRGRSTLVNCAVSDAEAMLRFVPSVDDPALGHLTDDAVEDSIEVPCRTLDDICADLERIDLVKIDVEGHEARALAGAAEIIRRHRPLVLMEYAPGHIERQLELGAFHEQLRVLGFAHVYEIEGGKLVATSYDALPSERRLRNVVLSDRPIS